MTYNNTRHRDSVISLWRRIFACDTPRNRPEFSIDKKLEAGDGLFFVALEKDSRDETLLTGTIMAGYDGHRGWIYSLCVAPEFRGRDIGSALIHHAEQALAQRGCFKVNLQIVESNSDVQEFYEKNGYSVEARISMGKVLPHT